MSTPAIEDRRWLARAVCVARTVTATTSPNPNVGCVLVRDGALLADGATAPPGGPHAEVVALQRAGAAARGATAYVSLEPCAHHGRTPACTDALRAAGVSRVVIAHGDPNPVAAGGANVLREAGIEVCGPLPPGDLLHAAVRQQLEGFLSVVRRGRPHVTLKLAQSADGSLVAPPGHRYLTGPEARRAVHRWRASVDAVLVGSGTVLVDDPRLDVREVRSDHRPRPVVFDGRLRTPATANVVAAGALVLTRPDAPSGARDALLAAGAEIEDVEPAKEGTGVDLVAALERLARHGIASVLAEPGRTLASALVRDSLADRVVLHVALGTGDGPPRRVLDVGQRSGWATERAGGAGPDLIWHLTPDTEPSPTVQSGGT